MTDEVKELLEEASNISGELRNKLSKISININGSKSPELITAVQTIFGKDYISSSGNTTITYDMYCSLLNLMRELGSKKTEDLA